MNASGDSISEILNFYKLDAAESLLVIFDDISLAPGNIRIRKKGSAGGHNGMKSVISRCGTSDFTRIKVGVGEKPEGWDLVDHVLGHFSRADRMLVDEAVSNACHAAGYIVNGRIDQAMNEFNVKKHKE